MAKKNDGRKMSKPQQEQARRQAMRLLAEGWTQQRTSQAVGANSQRSLLVASTHTYAA